jgi:hypothetical protein
MNTHEVSALALERMVTAPKKVRERLLRSTRALEQSKIPYAIAGANAVAAWVASVDESAVRNTPDVHLLVRELDFEHAKETLTQVGFVHHRKAVANLFLDGAEGSERQAVRVWFAGMKLRDDSIWQTPDVNDALPLDTLRVLNLEPLVRWELAVFRTVNMVHVRDLIDVGLIDKSWLPRLPDELAIRLKELLLDAEG